MEMFKTVIEQEFDRVLKDWATGRNNVTGRTREERMAATQAVLNAVLKIGVGEVVWSTYYGEETPFIVMEDYEACAWDHYEPLVAMHGHTGKTHNLYIGNVRRLRNGQDKERS